MMLLHRVNRCTGRVEITLSQCFLLNAFSFHSQILPVAHTKVEDNEVMFDSNVIIHTLNESCKCPAIHWRHSDTVQAWSSLG